MSHRHVKSYTAREATLLTLVFPSLYNNVVILKRSIYSCRSHREIVAMCFVPCSIVAVWIRSTFVLNVIVIFVVQFSPSTIQLRIFSSYLASRNLTFTSSIQTTGSFVDSTIWSEVVRCVGRTWREERSVHPPDSALARNTLYNFVLFFFFVVYLFDDAFSITWFMYCRPLFCNLTLRE